MNGVSGKHRVQKNDSYSIQFQSQASASPATGWCHIDSEVISINSVKVVWMVVSERSQWNKLSQGPKTHT